jgi:hypothetical protein
MNHGEFEDVVLSAPDAVDQGIFSGPDARLGGAESDVGLRHIRLRIGRRPTVQNMRKLYDALDVEYARSLKLFENYEVWLFSFAVHLIKDGGFNTVRRLGCQVKFPEDRDVSIVSQLPDSEFIAAITTDVKASAAFDVNGRANVPELGASAATASFKIGGGLSASASADALVNLSLSVMTARVIATGTGDYLGEWSIKRGDQPLLGEQHFLSSVLVPKDDTSLAVSIRAYVEVASPYLVSARLKSEWVDVRVPLDKGSAVALEQ